MTIPIGKTVAPALIKLPIREPKIVNSKIDGADWIRYQRQLASVVPQYQEGSFTATLTGMTATVTGTMEFRIVGFLCFITVPTSITGTSNAVNFTITGAPSFINPINARTASPVAFENNTTFISGSINIPAGGGTWTCRSDFGTGAWTNINVKGIMAQTFCYPMS